MELRAGLGVALNWTNGFIKKKRKMPPGEIARAIKYKADYEGRLAKK
jgi:hypothetical protein